jgi:TRAP transporter TAXI family solute receptor
LSEQSTPKLSARSHRIAAIVMVVIIVGSVATWYFTRDRLPSRLRLATGSGGGLYHELGELYAAQLSARLDRPIEVLTTAGSVENVELLREGGADLAIVQGGSASLEGLGVLAPLYEEVLHIIVRAGSDIEDPAMLEGRAVALGPTGSGTRDAALQVLAHYDIDPSNLAMSEHYFTALETEPELEAAFAISGYLNPDLKRLLASGRYRLVALDQAEAFALLHTHFEATQIPRGIFGGHSACPAEPTPTVATRAYLVADRDASGLLVVEALDALYDGSVRDSFPILTGRQQATETTVVTLHPEAGRYFDPYGGIDLVASFMESLAAGKELLLAVGAGVFLIWERYRRARERETEALVKQQKEHLDDFLNRTLVIERAQMETDDPEILHEHLREVTRIKLTALEELTHEDLRGDQMFQIFLMQCANLIRKIQARL